MGKMTDTSGQRCLERFEKLSQSGLWAKMFSVLLIGTMDWYSRRCKLTWKLKGTKYNRSYFQLQVSTHHINDIEFGLLQTSSTMEISEPPEKMRERALNNGYKNGTKYNGLLSQMLYSGILPTPSAGNEKSGGTMTEWGGNGNKMRQIPGD